jgi:spoIIIJ-associated protein
VEWVETTGKSVDEALAVALEQLGVDQDEVDFEVLEEAKTGLFGRVRNDARIRARIRPSKPRAKEDRKDKRAATAPAASASASGAAKPKRAPRATKATAAVATNASADSSDSSDASESVPSAPVRRVRKSAGAEADALAREVGTKFLEGLLDSFRLVGTVDVVTVGEDITEFRILGKDLGVLIGQKAQTLQAVQEILRTVVHYGTDGASGRILLDVAGYREKRRIALEAFTRQVIEDVLASGERRALEPMSAADRKVVHDTVNSVSGVSSMSEGEDPERRVVLLPA